MMGNTLHQLDRRRERAGFTLFESIMAIGFLSVAMTAMLKVNRSLHAYDAQTHQGLVNAMTLDNLIGQLNSLEPMSRLAEAEQLASKLGAQVFITPFEGEPLDGSQLRFTLGQGATKRVRYLWIYEVTP
jgi:hypothetical protein